MAKITAQVMGGDIKQHEVKTLGELKQKLDVSNYQATINDEPVDNDSYEFEGFEMVELTAKVKGAQL